MIYLYSGTPGSGKSLHTAKDIVTRLRRGKAVIANFPVNLDYIRATPLKVLLLFLVRLFHLKIDLAEKFEYKLGVFTYIDNGDLTPEFLVKYAYQNNRKGREGQTLLIVDECSILYNCREFSRSDRSSWVKFYQHHRKLGYNVILVCQNDRMIDRQIRAFIEYDVKHRKANNFGTIGMLLSLFGIKLFAAVSYWYGVREKSSTEFFRFHKGLTKVYDSFEMFDDELKDCGEDPRCESGVGGSPVSEEILAAKTS